jgi:hypothetical protein
MHMISMIYVNTSHRENVENPGKIIRSPSEIGRYFTPYAYLCKNESHAYSAATQAYNWIFTGQVFHMSAQ